MANIIQILRTTVFGNRPGAGAQPYGTPYVNFAENQFGVVASGLNPRDLIGVPFFSTGANYNVGQPVNNAGQLYIATASVTAGAFNPAQWSSVSISINGKVSKTGDTMTGNLTITGSAPYVALNKTATSGQDAYISGTVNGLARWSIDVCNNSPETGSNSGSDLSFVRFADNGTYIDQPLIIMRNSGVTISNAGFQAPGSGYNGLTISSSSFDGSLYTSFITNANVNGNPVTMFGRNSYGAWVRAYFQVLNSFLYFDHAGAAAKPGGGSWVDTSDIRIKTEISEYKSGLDAVVSLRPVTFFYKGNDTHDAPKTGLEPDAKSFTDPAPYPNSSHYFAAVNQIPYIGLIAQELEDIFPEMISQTSGFIDGKEVTDIRMLDTSPLIFALINAVKELKARIEALEAK